VKVLITTDPIGGVWTYTLDLARALGERDVQVVVAVMGAEPTEDQRVELDATPLLAWEARPYRLEWMTDAWKDVEAAGEWLLDLAERHDVDVVHLNGFVHAALAWERPVVVVAHSDVVTWWRAVRGEDPPPEWDAYRARVELGLHAADLVVAPTAAMLHELRQAFRVERDAAVIHNGRSQEMFGPAAMKEHSVVAVGRVWDEAKNIMAAARAADGLPWPLLVAGAGEVPGATSLGRVQPREVAELVARASIFVEPALYEPFGLAALEAALAGCALVLGDIPSLREVWRDAATFVPSHDEDALRRTLDALMRDPESLRARQAAALGRARTFTVGAMAHAYLGRYTALVAGGRVATSAVGAGGAR